MLIAEYSYRSLQRSLQLKFSNSLTLTTDVKSSSKIIMSELSLATSVPDMPIERPISAYTTNQTSDKRIK
jgi:hypothetical protein